MNTKEYILSGIIESYVLGLASEEERAEFEQMCRQYPEVMEARKAFEVSLEQQAMEDAIAPPPEIKEGFLATIKNTDSTSASKVISISADPKIKTSGGWVKYFAAASVILLLGSAFVLFYLYNQNKELKASLQSSQKEMDQFKNELAAMQEGKKLMSDPNVAVVSLTGTEKAPQSSANIYWDSTSSNVYLVVKNMPKLPSNKQYQLWALINGKPKDLGLFDVNDNRVILKMKNVQKAEAFAITIENRGNMGGPSLDQMQSFGKAGL
ncbi:MAG: anti-sigma factor [Bacteroidetes bacterium]|nr:anti-sigma factor [Bacteroidota bacterium]